MSVRFADDGKRVTYLLSPDGTLTRQLYVQDLAGGERQLIPAPIAVGDTEQNLSPEEKLQRERRREHGLGITRYAWSKTGNVLLVPLQGDLWVKHGLTGEFRKVVDSDGAPALSPRLSPDGSMVAYVQDRELYVVSTTSGRPRQLTRGARGTGKTHGLAEFIAQEEMGRHEGYWWSRDGKYLAFAEVDETHIPRTHIVHQGSERTGPQAEEAHGYPFPGADNARVRLGVVPVRGGKTVWMDLGGDPDIYLARVNWMPSGRVWAQVENRAQSELRLVNLDPRTGKSTPVLTETSAVWINLHDGLHPLGDETSGGAAGGFVWMSERSGFMHIYLYDAQGELVRPLTSGDWPVDGIVEVDEAGKRVYFTSGKDDPTQRQLYEVGFAGGEPRRVTPEPGSHSVDVDTERGLFIDSHSSMTQAPRVLVRRLDTAEIVATIHDAVDPRIAELQLVPPQLVKLKSRDGVTLHAAVYQPPKGYSAPYPTVVSVYGGPHAQMVADRWGMTADLRAQYLRSQGFLVFKIDNRGSARRGLAFEGAIRHDMGNVEVRDQVDGVRWLVNQGLADEDRVGIYGWSYGGYMAAMAVARAPDTFHAAVAGAPVTHWDGYDTHYTERYMGTPQGNPKGYQDSSVMHHIAGMRGSLMLVHGLIDENVHFRHTARLVNALIKAKKHYELLMFPNERHSPRSEQDRVYMEGRVSDFLRRSVMERRP